jgi:sec-independent protein translocase protein TatA
MEVTVFGRIAEHPLSLVILVLLVVVVFGAKRLPDAARSLGRSMRIFKSEVREMKDEDKSASRAPGTPSRPLEGKVLDGEDVRTDAQRAGHVSDSQRHSA